MKKKLIKISLLSVKIMLVFIITLALLVDGVGACQRLITNNCEVEQLDEPIVDTPLLKSGPPAPEELPGEMADGSKANTEQSAVLQAQVIVKNDNPQQRLRVFENNKIVINNITLNFDRESNLMTSVTLIDSYLGHRFTLVGSKPSGTM